MIVRNGLSVLIYRTAKNGMCKLITCSFNFPSSVDESMASLSCHNRVQHNAVISTGRVLHSCRNVHTADSQTVLLVLNRTCTNCYVGKKVGKVAPVLRIKHLICAGKLALLNSADVHLTDGNKSGKHIRLFLRVWLMNHTLIALSGSTRFIRINSWND